MQRFLEWCLPVSLALVASGATGCGAANEDHGDETISLVRTEQPIVPGAQVIQYSQVYTLPAGGHLQNISASCPSGTTPVGGGYVGTTNMRVYASYGSRGSWFVSVFNVSTANSYTINIVIQCLSGAPNSTLSQYWSGRKMLPPHSFGCVSAVCLSGIVTGGGFSSATAFRPTSNLTPPASAHEWSVCGRNDHPTDSILLDAMASCLERVPGRFSDILTDVPRIEPGGPATVISNPCPSGMLLASGGYEGSDDFDGTAKAPHLTAIGSFRSFQDPARWTHEFLNLSPTRKRGAVRTTCLELY
jgi:hypothetical protein